MATSKSRNKKKKKHRFRPYALAEDGAQGVGAVVAFVLRALFQRDGETVVGRVAGLALLTIVGVAAVFGVGPLRGVVGSARADPLVLEFAWPHVTNAEQTWLPESVQWDLEQRAIARIAPDPFDRASLDSARWSLVETGWFQDDSIRVVRKPGGVVSIVGQWRTPAAVVRVGDVDHLVATGGELLPLEYRAGAATPLRVITGAWAGPPTDSAGVRRFGMAWVGGDVQAALDLLALLRTTDAWPHVAGVDVSRFMDHDQLVIETTEGAEVVWGAAPGARAPGEQDDAEKLSRFALLMNNAAWLNAGRPRVDLWTPYVYLDESASPIAH